MNIDQNVLVSYRMFNSCSTKRQKTAFFVMNFVNDAQNQSFTKMLIKIDICVIRVSFNNISPLTCVFICIA